VINREKKKTDSAPAQIILSSENLLLKAELDKKKLKIDSLRQNIAQENKNKMFEFEQQVLRKRKQIEDQKSTMEAKAKENQDRLTILEQATKDSIEGYHKMLEQMRVKHDEALERLIADQKEKVDADHQRQEELQAEIKEQQNKFENCSAQLYLTQDQGMKKMEKEHEQEHAELEAEKQGLSKQIEQMVQAFQETRAQVEHDTWERIDKQKEDDKAEMAR
jgi:hypothetical protein